MKLFPLNELKRQLLFWDREDSEEPKQGIDVSESYPLPTSAVIKSHDGSEATVGSAGADFGGGADFNAENLGLYLLPGETVCVTAQNVAGSENVTARVVFNWIELF